MQIKIPVLTRPILLTDYAPELVHPESKAPITVYVWVNPTRAVLQRHAELVERKKHMALPEDAEQIGREAIAWYAELWSQHSDTATHLSADEVQALIVSETDPAFYAWLTQRSWALIVEHRDATKKK